MLKNAAVVLLLSLLGPPAVVGQEDLPDVVAVRVFKTPGQAFHRFRPDLPAEEILIEKRNEELYALIVRINVPRTMIVQYTDRQVAIGRAEFEAIVALVVEHGLLDWKARRDRRGIDSDEAGFTIRGGKGNDQSWKGRAADSKGVEALFRQMALLAERRADVEIEFID